MNNGSAPFKNGKLWKPTQSVQCHNNFEICQSFTSLSLDRAQNKMKHEGKHAVKELESVSQLEGLDHVQHMCQPATNNHL